MSGHVLSRCQDTGVARAIPTVVLATSECKPAPPAVPLLVGKVFVKRMGRESEYQRADTTHANTPFTYAAPL